MPQHGDWVPMRWPSGPAAIASLKTAAQDHVDTLTAWHQPEALSIVRNSPVNCIVVTWANGGPKDAEQRSTLQPLVAQAKKQEVSVVGMTTGDYPAAIEAAKAAGLDGVVLDKSSMSNVAAMALISLTPAAEEKGGGSPIAAVSDAVWPHIPPRRGGGAGAGPTGTPWVDSNGWRVQLANVKAAGKKVWLVAEAPASLNVTDGAYIVAVADAEAYGAKWIISLQPELRRRLVKAEANATETWKSITGALGFFDNHKAWRSQTGVARLGVISDFSTDNRFMAQEMLNLAARRPLPSRIIDRAGFSAQSLAGLQTVMWMDAQLPDAAARSVLLAFVQRGGLLVAPMSSASVTDGMKSAGTHEGRLNVFAHGKGRLAIATKPWGDPYVLVSDAHLLMSRKHDVIRAWNGGASNFNYTATPDRRSAVVQIVNYTGRPSGEDMSLYVAHPYKRAVLHRLQSREGEPLKVTPKAEGVEVYVPPFTAYAAVEFGV